MEKRRANRIKHRLTCELLVGQQAFPAVVRDLGPTGLFVQTRARPNANSVVEVRFPATAGLPGFCIEAGVARHRNVHPRLQAEIQSGIGLEILGRPADYLAYAKRVVEPKVGDSSSAMISGRPPAAATTASNEMRRFRIRLTAFARSAPRTITVQASSIAAARAQAMTQAGAGWKITDVETI